jgi:hypothetical protein
MAAKLARADEHFEAIKADIESVVRAYVQLIPNEFDVQSGHYVFRAQRDSVRPDWLSPIIGDCIHNMRAALDYLVWELVAVAGNKGGTSNEFPIFTDSRMFRRHAPIKWLGAPDGADAVFERLQPFYGPNSDPFHPEWREPGREPLAFLHDLDIADKHRSLNLTEEVHSLRIVGLEHSGIHVPPLDSTLMGNFHAGAVLARMSGFDLRPEMDVHLRATTDVAFDRDGPADGEKVVQVLEDIRDAITGRVIPGFRRFFPTPLPAGLVRTPSARFFDS